MFNSSLNNMNQILQDWHSFSLITKFTALLKWDHWARVYFKVNIFCVLLFEQNPALCGSTHHTKPDSAVSHPPPRLFGWINTESDTVPGDLDRITSRLISLWSASSFACFLPRSDFHTGASCSRLTGKPAAELLFSALRIPHPVATTEERRGVPCAADRRPQPPHLPLPPPPAVTPPSLRGYSSPLKPSLPPPSAGCTEQPTCGPSR